MSEEDSGYLEGYIRGSLLPGYKDYCPLFKVGAQRQDNGLYRVHGDDDIELPKSEYLSNAGFLIVQLGMVERDYTLETAAFAIHHSLHSLFSACDAPVDLEKFRTTVELSEFMKIYRCNYSHVILVGHGSSQGIDFLDKRNPVAGSELGGLLGADKHHNPLQLISLCCHSGCEALSSALSTAGVISEVIAPNEEFDLRWSVHFITGFYLYRYVTGLSVDASVVEASKNATGLRMCVWRNGELGENCK